MTKFHGRVCRVACERVVTRRFSLRTGNAARFAKNRLARASKNRSCSRGFMVTRVEFCYLSTSCKVAHKSSTLCLQAPPSPCRWLRLVPHPTVRRPPACFPPGGTQQSFIRGGSSPRSKPLPFYIPFRIPFVKKFYLFHIPAERVLLNFLTWESP